MSETSMTDVAVVGAGPAGLTAAILLAETGIATTLIAQRTLPDDRRTTALLGGSVALMQSIGVWDDIVSHGCEVDIMRLVDDTGRLIRAPEANFHAREIGLPSFGANVGNRDLWQILVARADATPNLTCLDAKVGQTELTASAAILTLDGGATVAARLAVAADGRHSGLRAAAAIRTDEWTYPQAALVCNVAVEYGHDRVCTEFHGPNGPYVLVPLSATTVSIVLLDTPATIERLAILDDEALGRALEARAHSILGRMTLASGRQVFPLSGLLARSFAARRVALVGEAGHAFPPVGAQGLNLGLRDVAHLAEIVGGTARRGDPGGTEVLAAYDARRRFDVRSRTFGVDVMDRALLSDHLPAQVARAVGLGLAEHIGPLRRLVMREGLVPTFGAPKVMRRSGASGR